jgi:hypothetical protein
MNITQELVETYVDRSLVKRNVLGDFTLYCYSQETFFDKSWDEVTKSCRGLIFYKSEIINHPFPKIFNLDENKETTLDHVMRLIDNDEKYVICHKVNGHLCIVDYIPELDKFLVHTKGSLQKNEMNQTDKEMFLTQHTNMIQRIRSNGERATFMFESLHESDKHTLYDQEVAKYGENKLVLLGAYYYFPNKDKQKKWKPLLPWSLKKWADLDGNPCVEHDEVNTLDKDSIKRMFDEIDTEGYVIWFTNIDLRVKIKTIDYWKMRFRKELTPDTIIDKFVSGGSERIQNRYPEEIADKAVELIDVYFMKYMEDFASKIPSYAFGMTNKQLGLSDKLTSMQKSAMFSITKKRKGSPEKSLKFSNNKHFRLDFKNYMNDNESYKKEITDSLIKYIEERGE